MNKDEQFEYRKNLIESLNTLSDSYDKYLLTFATGGLYLSIFFIKDTWKVGIKLAHTGFLLTSWISLAATILLTLLSLLLGIQAVYTEIRDFDNDEPQKQCLNLFITFLNVLSLITFVNGMAFLATFYYLNLI